LAVAALCFQFVGLLTRRRSLEGIARELEPVAATE
jgi:hypothetical protein